MNLDLNLAHLHLLLNHFPTIGTIVGLGLFVFSLLGKNEDLKRASLGIFVLIAVVTVPAYLTGRAAQEAVLDSPDVTQALIENHQDQALLAFAFMQLTGLFSWFGLWQVRRISRVAGWNLAAVLLLSIVTLGLMASTANLGGEIRHPEIRSGQDTTVSEGTAP
jgi:uncharacterized membrane protein